MSDENDQYVDSAVEEEEVVVDIVPSGRESMSGSPNKKISTTDNYPGKDMEGKVSDQVVHKCPKCNHYIQAGSVVVDGIHLHPKCFTCMKCNTLCRIEFYQKVNNKFYCQPCVDKTPELYNTLRNQKLAAIEAEKARQQAIIDEENARKQAIIDEENREKARQQALIDAENERIRREQEEEEQRQLQQQREAEEAAQAAATKGSARATSTHAAAAGGGGEGVGAAPAAGCCTIS